MDDGEKLLGFFDSGFLDISTGKNKSLQDALNDLVWPLTSNINNIY